MRRDIPRLPGRAVEALSSRGGRLVRFPCGHTEAEAHLARTLRERKNCNERDGGLMPHDLTIQGAEKASPPYVVARHGLTVRGEGSAGQRARKDTRLYRSADAEPRASGVSIPVTFQ